MSEKIANPTNTEKKRENCPVCGKVSYSQSGIHPQCAAKLSDEKRKDEIKQKKLVEENNQSERPTKKPRWQIKCAKCGAPQHVRKKICECGNKLVVDPHPTEND